MYYLKLQWLRNKDSNTFFSVECEIYMTSVRIYYEMVMKIGYLF